MKWPIVNVTTKDNLPLYGMLSEAKKSKTLLVNMHGTASNFYEEDFMGEISESLVKNGISVLSANNRGAMVLENYPARGAALENFEDCLLDIDAWIEFALSLGYKYIILQGHSLGTEKAVYYMNKGKHREKIAAVILLAFSDSYGNQMKYLNGKKDVLMPEAKKLVAEGKGEFFLSSDWLSHSGVLPKSAKSYINFFSEGSELSKALPLRKGKNLDYYSRIKIPILAVIGDEKEYTIIPIKEALNLLEKENKLSEVHQIKNCNHDFEGREEELTKIISSFIKENKLG